MDDYTVSPAYMWCQELNPGLPACQARIPPAELHLQALTFFSGLFIQVASVTQVVGTFSVLRGLADTCRVDSWPGVQALTALTVDQEEETQGGVRHLQALQCTLTSQAEGFSLGHWKGGT